MSFARAGQGAKRPRWADTAEPIVCPACQTTFKPHHPLQLYCKRPECPGRRAPSGRRRPGSNRAPTSQRRAGIQGVLADVLLHTHTGDLVGNRNEIREAVRGWVEAERSGRRVEIHAALVRLQACCAVRTIVVAPPPSAAPDEPTTP